MSKKHTIIKLKKVLQRNNNILEDIKYQYHKNGYSIHIDMLYMLPNDDILFEGSFSGSDCVMSIIPLSNTILLDLHRHLKRMLHSPFLRIYLQYLDNNKEMIEDIGYNDKTILCIQEERLHNFLLKITKKGYNITFRSINDEGKKYNFILLIE